MLSKYGKGLIKDSSDVRDFLFAPHMSADELPKKVSWEEFMAPIAFDQGNLGSCTGNGSAGGLIILLKRSNYKWMFTPSRLKIYYDARQMEGTVTEDAGAMIRDVFKGMNLYGVAPEDSNPEWSWPYSSTDNRWQLKPPEACYTDAKLHVLVQYERVDLSEDHLKAAIVKGPVVFGMSLKESFESNKVAVTGKVPVPKSSEADLGGHCMLAFGYGNKDSKCVDVRNSWGAWGDKGNCHIPFEMFAEYGSDAWQPQIISAV
jgi:C1A family cysteine protease